MVCMYWMILHVTFLQVKLLVALLATSPIPMAMTPEEAQRISSVVNAQYAQQATIVGQPAYQSAQQLFWDQRRKRGPPTPAFSSTGLATPSGPAETAMDAEAPPQTTPPASSTTPTGPTCGAQPTRPWRTPWALTSTASRPWTTGWGPQWLREPMSYRHSGTTIPQ